MRRYISSSDISFNVLIGGKRRNICFGSLSSGGSDFICDNKEVCDLIEKHPEFGSLFTIDAAFEQKTKPANKMKSVSKKDSDKIPEKEENPEEESEEEENPEGESEEEDSEEESEEEENPEGESEEEDSEEESEEEENPEEESEEEDSEEESEEEETPEEESESESDIDVAPTPIVEVTSLSEAREYFKGQGIPITSLKSKAAIFAAAKEKNICFPNLDK